VLKRFFAVATMLVSLSALASERSTGTLTVDGKSVTLPNVVAYHAKSDFRDAQDVVLFFTDFPISTDPLEGGVDLRRDLESGKSHAIVLTIDSDNNVYGFAVYHKDLGLSTSTKASFNQLLDFKDAKVTADSISGHITGPKNQDIAVAPMSGSKWSFGGTVNASIRPSAEGREITGFLDSLEGAGGATFARLYVEGAPATLRYVRAFTSPNAADKKKRDTVLVFSDKKLSAPKSRADLPALLGDAHAIVVQLSPDRVPVAGTVYDPKWSAPVAVSDPGSAFALAPTAFTDDKIAGKLATPARNDQGHKWRLVALFAAPIVETVLRGDPLPKGGGAPGKAYLALNKAVRAGEIAKVKKLVSAERRASMDDPDFPKMFELIKMMAPAKVTIVSGVSDGATATLEVEGEDGGNKTKGKVHLILEEKNWVVSSEEWGGG
jgi:hypothetical protein